MARVWRRWTSGEHWHLLWLFLFAMLMAMFMALFIIIKLNYHHKVEIGESNGAMSRVVALIVTDLSWDAIFGFLGTVSGGFLVLMGFQLQKRQAQADTYQKLELASIELFRWQVEHPRLTEAFWGRDYVGVDTRGAIGSAPAEVVAKQALDHYAFQVANLFEMAVRSHRTGGMPPDVLGAWARWIWEFVCAPGFDDFWKDARRHYVKALRDILDRARDISVEDESENR